MQLVIFYYKDAYQNFYDILFYELREMYSASYMFVDSEFGFQNLLW
jgi:hypothetical protein